jgi:hypothetical protein
MYRCGFHSLLPASEECMHYLPHLLHLKALKISVFSSFSFEDKRETAREDFRELGSRLSIAHTVCLSLFFFCHQLDWAGRCCLYHGSGKSIWYMHGIFFVCYRTRDGLAWLGMERKIRGGNADLYYAITACMRSWIERSAPLWKWESC